MLYLFPNSTILLHLLRIFGHFPYAWVSHNEEKKVSSDMIFNLKIHTEKICDKNSYVFVSSKLWKIWSISFCFVIILFTIYSAVEENYLVEGRIFGIDTIRAPYIIFDCLLYSSLFLMYFSSMKNSDKLCKILNKLYHLISTTKIDVKKNYFIDFSWMAPYLGLIAVSILLSITGLEQIPLFRNIYHICFYLFITAVNMLLTSIYSSILHGILSTVGSLYEVVFSELLTYSQYIEKKFCNSPLEICSDKHSNSSKISENILELDKTNNISRNTITLYSIRKCKISMLQLYSYKRLIIDYFEYLMIIFLAYLISSTIIPVFFMTVLNRSFKEILMPFFHAIASIVSLLCILNAPYKMNETMERARYSIVVIRYYEEKSNLNEKLTELLNLLDEDNGLQFCGIFKLARARIVDIGSFVATYIVILLQFRMSDDKMDQKSGRGSDLTVNNSTI